MPPSPLPLRVWVFSGRLSVCVVNVIIYQHFTVEAHLLCRTTGCLLNDGGLPSSHGMDCLVSVDCLTLSYGSDCLTLSYGSHCLSVIDVSALIHGMDLLLNNDLIPIYRQDCLLSNDDEIVSLFNYFMHDLTR